MKDSTRYIFDELIQRYPVLTAASGDITAAFDLLHQCAINGGTILVCGNGGSASDAEHITGELMKGFMLRRELTKAQTDALTALYPDDAEYLSDNLQRAIPCISLVSQSSLLTAYSNDVASDMGFAQQVFGYAKPGDALIGITTSGASRNIINALKVAKAAQAKSVLLMGQRNEWAAQYADVAIRVPEQQTYKVQELHLPIYHALCAMLEYEIFGD
ncbi:phosphoheptose isomerase [Clostridia bacterium]|nr:phosphoheptose isomerase [Clostridia bacterium]